MSNDKFDSEAIVPKDNLPALCNTGRKKNEN